jgi:hypothetical protein
MIKTERDKFTDALAMLDAANTGIEYKKKLVLEEVDPALILDTMTTILPQGFDAPQIEDLAAGEVEPGFAAYSEARRDLALSKVPMAAEHVKRLVEAGEKVIVFGIHKDVIAELHKVFPTAARIVGGWAPRRSRPRSCGSKATRTPASSLTLTATSFCVTSRPAVSVTPSPRRPSWCSSRCGRCPATWNNARTGLTVSVSNTTC